MDIVDLIGYAIESKHGTSVSNQFESSWSDGDFEECNINALSYIKPILSRFIKSTAINHDCKHEIREYKEELETYLNNPIT